MRRIVPKNEWQTSNRVQGIVVERHAPERSFEGFNTRERNASDGNVMGRTDQHDACEGLCAPGKRCEGRGGGRARIDVACMWRDQRFGSAFRNRPGIGEEFNDLSPQSIRLRRIKAARNRWSTNNHDCGPACTLPGLQLVTMSNSERLNRTSHESTDYRAARPLLARSA